jgi:hypothetical protein
MLKGLIPGVHPKTVKFKARVMCKCNTFFSLFKKKIKNGKIAK